MFNTSKKLAVDFYADADFAGLCGHENPQYPIYDRIRTGFVATFSNFTLLWISELPTYIALSTLHSEYVALSHSVRALLPLNSLIKKIIENLRIDSENLNFVSISSFQLFS